MNENKPSVEEKQKCHYFEFVEVEDKNILVSYWQLCGGTRSFTTAKNSASKTSEKESTEQQNLKRKCRAQKVTPRLLLSVPETIYLHIKNTVKHVYVKKQETIFTMLTLSTKRSWVSLAILDSLPRLLTRF